MAEGVSRASAGSSVVVSRAKNAPPRLIGAHSLFWSSDSKLLAVMDVDGARVVQPDHPEKEVDTFAATEIFGFRADAETLVIAQGGELVDWSTRTSSGRPSVFHRAATGAAAICLAPDDVHFVALDDDGLSASWRSRTSDEVLQLDTTDLSTGEGRNVEVGPQHPIVADCAFARSGSAFALAGDGGVVTFAAGAAVTERAGGQGADDALRVSVPDVMNLSWSADGQFVSFWVHDRRSPSGLPGMFWIWEPRRQAASMFASFPAAVDSEHRRVFRRAQSEAPPTLGCDELGAHASTRWEWTTFDGKPLGRDKPKFCGLPPPWSSAREISVAPNASFVAALHADGDEKLVVKRLR